MGKQIKLNYKMGKLKGKIFMLCGLSIRKMTVFFIGLWLAIQGIFVSLEFLIFGEFFPHIGDSLVTIFIASAYIYYSHALGDFLLELQLKGEVEYE